MRVRRGEGEPCRDGHPGATLLVVGDGPLLGDTARAIGRARLGASVRLLGRSDDIGILLAMARLLFVAAAFKGLPLVVPEAFAAGLPVVASDVPGVAEAIDHGRTGWLSPVGDAPALGRTIALALHDEPAGRGGQGGARRLDERYRAERMAGETAAIYRAVTADRHWRERQELNRTRLAFIGADGIAHRRFDVLEQFDDVEIVGVCDADIGRAIEGAQRFGARPFDAADAMLDTVEGRRRVHPRAPSLMARPSGRRSGETCPSLSKSRWRPTWPSPKRSRRRSPSAGW